MKFNHDLKENDKCIACSGERDKQGRMILHSGTTRIYLKCNICKYTAKRKDQIAKELKRERIFHLRNW